MHDHSWGASAFRRFYDNDRCHLYRARDSIDAGEYYGRGRSDNGSICGADQFGYIVNQRSNVGVAGVSDENMHDQH